MPLRDRQIEKLDARTLEMIQVLELEVQDLILHSAGGVGTLSMRMGYASPESLSNEVCPTNRQAKFGVLDFFLALTKTRNYRVLDVLDSMLQRDDSRPRQKFENLFVAIGQLGCEHADVVGAVVNSLADDNEISAREKVLINKEIDEVVSALNEVRDMVNKHGGA